MKKLFSVLLALALMILFIVPVRAQDPLTKTVVAGTSDFPYSFKYPADWGEPQKAFANTQIDNADGSIHASISYPFTAGSTKEALEKYATSYPNKADIQSFTLDGRDAARLDGPIANRWQILMVVNDGNANGLITFEGSKATLTKAEPTLLAIAASLHAPPDSGDAAAANTPVPSATPTDAPMTQSNLGEGAILAIVDGPIGGSTGMGNELYELNIDTKTGQSLKKFGTSSSAFFTQVAWSPDGSQLAYYAVDPPGLTVVDPDGGNSQIVVGVSFVSAWAPDGKHITNATQNGQDWMINNLGLSGEAAQPVLTIKNMSYIDYIRWSPDGKWLAYVGEPAGNSNNDEELHIIDATGNNDQVIVPAGKLEHNAMWSPDSTQIAYIVQSGAGAGLTTFNIATKTTKVIAEQVLAADWSPDGKQFAYATRDGKLFVSNADGTKPQEITRPADLQGQIVAIAWQPGTATASTPAEASTTTSTTGISSNCTVTSVNGANLRGGPGTTFARAGSLAAGTSQTVTGQAKGDDSFVWWKLENGSWVRSDVVQTAGDCSAVPTATS